MESEETYKSVCTLVLLCIYRCVLCICVLTLVFVLLGCLCTDKTDVKNWEQLISLLGNFKCTFLNNAEPRQYSLWFFCAHFNIQLTNIHVNISFPVPSLPFFFYSCYLPNNNSTKFYEEFLFGYMKFFIFARKRKC